MKVSLNVLLFSTFTGCILKLEAMRKPIQRPKVHWCTLPP